MKCQWPNRRWMMSLIALAALGIASIPGARLLVINTSPSVAPGIYLRAWDSPRVGAIVDFPIPPLAHAYVRGRSGQDGADWYILKPIAAGPGDRIDTTGPWLIINGNPIAPMPPERDSAGRLLPRWRACRELRPGEFFVFSSRIPNSFDSRCYGPVRLDQIDAVRIPLLTW